MGEARPVRIIAGLGNPGTRYERTRHNIGFMVVDALRERAAPAASWKSRGEALVCEAELGGGRVLLMKPQAFMNMSGRPVAELQRFYRCEAAQVAAVHDDVDLAFGQLRIKRGGGDAGHNGIASLAAWMGSADFLRVRCGIGRSAHEQEMVSWVLGRFDAEEMRGLPELVERAAAALEELCAQGLLAAQNRFNRRPVEEGES